MKNIRTLIGAVPAVLLCFLPRLACGQLLLTSPASSTALSATDITLGPGASLVTSLTDQPYANPPQGTISANQLTGNLSTYVYTDDANNPYGASAYTFVYQLNNTGP